VKFKERPAALFVLCEATAMFRQQAKPRGGVANTYIFCVFKQQKI